jgi:hypothetical protein
MNKEEILKFVQSVPKDSNKNEMLELPMRPIDKYKNILKELGFEEGEWGQNGWQVDFWQDWDHPIYGQYTFAGSLYYGGWSLTKNDEE